MLYSPCEEVLQERRKRVPLKSVTFHTDGPEGHDGRQFSVQEVCEGKIVVEVSLLDFFEVKLAVEPNRRFPLADPPLDRGYLRRVEDPNAAPYEMPGRL